MTTAPAPADAPHLIPTRDAAWIAGTSPAGFRGWAKRNGIKAAAYRPTGNAGHPQAWWDVNEIRAAVRRTEARRTTAELTKP